MKPLLLKNGRVVDPASKLDARRDVLIEDGRLAAVDAKIERTGAEVFDAANLVVAPGFIDMHVHLREPGKEAAETIQSGARAAAAGGFTALASMPNTQPANDTALVTRYILAQAAQAGGARVYPVGAVTKNLAGEELAELESLRAAGAVAFSDDGRPVWNSRILRRALEYAAALNLVVIDHCEDPQLAAGGGMHEGDRAPPPGGPPPHHSPGPADPGRGYPPRAKMTPPLRTADDVAALVEGLADGTVDAIASDHAPHTPTEKQADFESAPFGVIGLETAVALALDKLFHASKITLPRLVELFSANPARILGVEGGQLKVGAPADLTVLDLERKWTYRADEGVSKSRNSPFDGWSFRGAAAATIVAGTLVFCARKI